MLFLLLQMTCTDQAHARPPSHPLLLPHSSFKQFTQAKLPCTVAEHVALGNCRCDDSDEEGEPSSTPRLGGGRPQRQDNMAADGQARGNGEKVGLVELGNLKPRAEHSLQAKVGFMATTCFSVSVLHGAQSCHPWICQRHVHTLCTTIGPAVHETSVSY